MIRSLLNKFFYDQGVVVLLGGTVLAQLVPLMVAPALSVVCRICQHSPWMAQTRKLKRTTLCCSRS
jgi:hypothetical protein